MTRAVSSRTEGFQAGDLVTLIDRAISHPELRALCPAHSTPFDTTPDCCQRMSIESGSDLSLSLELSSSPQKPTTSLSANSFPELLDLSNSQLSNFSSQEEAVSSLWFLSHSHYNSQLRKSECVSPDTCGVTVADSANCA